MLVAVGVGVTVQANTDENPFDRMMHPGVSSQTDDAFVFCLKTATAFRG